MPSELTPSALACVLLVLAACEGGPRRAVPADGGPDSDTDTDTDTDTGTGTGTDTDTETDTDTDTETDTDTGTDTETDTGTGPAACEEDGDCDDSNACTNDTCDDGRCRHMPVAAGTSQGLCDECDGAGGHRPKPDDAACDVVECGDDSYAVSLMDPANCVLARRDPIDSDRCAALGACKTEDDCETDSEVVATLETCERFEPGTCVGAVEPVVENALAGARTDGCDATSCDGNVAVEAGCNGSGGCVAEYSRVDCGGLTCVADAEGARCE